MYRGKIPKHPDISLGYECSAQEVLEIIHEIPKEDRLHWRVVVDWSGCYYEGDTPSVCLRHD